jgi:hypothetical protein
LQPGDVLDRRLRQLQLVVSPAVPAAQGAYGGLMANVLHHTYLPFTADQLREHFAPVAGPGERDRHLRYYLASVEEARKYDELIRGGDRPTPAQTRLGRQMEKDERFWLATALMSLYHADDGSGRDSGSPACSSEPGCARRLASRAGRTRWPAPWTCSSKSISPRLPATAPGSAIIWANASRSLTSKSGRKRRGRG